jgi:hypothetical protein
MVYVVAVIAIQKVYSYISLLSKLMHDPYWSVFCSRKNATTSEAGVKQGAHMQEEKRRRASRAALARGRLGPCGATDIVELVAA